MNWYLTVGLLLGLLNLLVCVLVLAQIRSIYSGFWAALHSWVSAPNETTPSAFAGLVETIGHSLGHSAAVELKTTIMGKMSGQSRLETAIQGDMLQDQVGAVNPLMAAALEMFPSLKRRALKNPGIVDLILSRLPKTGPVFQAAAGDNKNEIRY